jgi:hypothetical protein
MIPMPATTMMWTITDHVIEDEKELERQFNDIRRAGFGGVAAFVRCSRYRWDQPAAIKACHRISELCRHHDIQFWAVPDPRFLSRQLSASSTGLPLLFFGDAVQAQKVPHTSVVEKNKFSIRCRLQPRHSHMIHEVAIAFTPAGVAAVYAIPSTKSRFLPEEIIDITNDAQFFYNAQDGYMEAFGFFNPPDQRSWKVIAFFRAFACHVNFADPVHMKAYLQKLESFCKAIGNADLIMWDEPGYTCVYGALPFSFGLQKEYELAGGAPLTTHLWKLALESEDGSHIEVRNRYYRIIQDSVNRAQLAAWKKAISIWGPQTSCGIHDTWHFESADMADMNHGSMDLWKAQRTKNGGFVDMGAINYLISPHSSYYANLASMLVICKSLGVFSRDKYAYNNLWTIGEDELPGEQKSVMNHCVNAMALFGNRWFAHIYGPVGTIGEEEQFLGSPQMPGYPHHSTWAGFPEWNQCLTEHMIAVDNQLPMSNILIIFPCETLYALADSRANAIAQDVFRFVLTLVDQHYQFDIISSAEFIKGKWQGDQFVVQDKFYKVVLFPFAGIVQAKVAELTRKKDRILSVFQRTEKSSENLSVSALTDHHATDTSEALKWLSKIPDLRPVEAPGDSWVTITQVSQSYKISLMPSRHGLTYGGRLVFKDQVLTLEEQKGLCRISVLENGAASVEMESRVEE